MEMTRHEMLQAMKRNEAHIYSLAMKYLDKDDALAGQLFTASGNLLAKMLDHTDECCSCSSCTSGKPIGFQMSTAKTPIANGNS